MSIEMIISKRKTISLCSREIDVTLSIVIAKKVHHESAGSMVAYNDPNVHNSTTQTKIKQLSNVACCTI